MHCLQEGGTSRISKNGIEAVLRRLGKAAEWKMSILTDTRRTLATNLLDRGMNIQMWRPSWAMDWT